jgi:replicative DNA helicase
MSKELFSTEAELAILNIILQNPATVYNLSSLKNYMFSSTPNQLIFTTVEELLAQNLVPEVNLIDSFLKSKGRSEKVGGREYLSYLEKQAYNPENLREFERQIIDSFKARSLINMATSVSPTLMENQDVDGVISSIRTTLDNLTSASGGDATSDLGTVLKESWEDINERIKNPGITGVTTGIHDIDLVTGGLAEGDLCFIAGRPGMGKTAMMCNMMLKQAKVGIPVLMFSLEMSKKTLAERLISLETGINSFNIRLGTLNNAQLNQISDAIRAIKGLPIYIDSSFAGSLSYILTTARKFSRNNNVKVCYLDYIQLLADRGSEATHELGSISRSLKLLAKELENSWVVGSQFNRLLETREDKRPQLSDLRQSGNLEEDADLVIGLYRDVMYNRDTKDKNVMESIILKQRSGPRGMLPLKFEEETGRIQDG